jgi:hypothetical protein
VVEAPFDDGSGAAVADREAKAHPSGDEEAAAGGAVEGGVARPV